MGTAKVMGTQVMMEEADEEYRAFVEKFKPKKTTDDCYTPENIYEAVAGWVCEEYGTDREKFVRPFWPGADYRLREYADGEIVVDIIWSSKHGVHNDQNETTTIFAA